MRGYRTGIAILLAAFVSACGASANELEGTKWVNVYQGQVQAMLTLEFQKGGNLINNNNELLKWQHLGDKRISLSNGFMAIVCPYRISDELLEFGMTCSAPAIGTWKRVRN